MTDRKRTIDVGDEVTVHWTEGDGLKGVVTHTPSDTGDMWYITSGDTDHAINPSCSSLEQIIKRRVGDPHD